MKCCSKLISLFLIAPLLFSCNNSYYKFACSAGEYSEKYDGVQYPENVNLNKDQNLYLTFCFGLRKNHNPRDFTDLTDDLVGIIVVDGVKTDISWQISEEEVLNEK